MSETRQTLNPGRVIMAPVEDFDFCYRAATSKDARFDGWFFTAVTSTGIYCRPSCPAMTPKRVNVRFFPTAAAAQAAGFRACMRCRPDASPGSPEWNQRADVVARAMRLIADGVVDRDGVSGLAARLDYSERQLQRVLVAEVGTGALALARAQRAQTARLLIETTDLSMAHVAFAAGFASVRQFNDTVRAVFAKTPSSLRAGSRHRSTPGTGAINLLLPHRKPYAADAMFGYLAARTVPGLEGFIDGAYVRSLRLPHGDGIVELAAEDNGVRAQLTLEDLRDLSTAVSRCRRLLDLDADPEAVDDALSVDPMLGSLVRAGPGRRVPGAVDGFEIAVRVIIGQQVSVAGAHTVAARLVAQAGRPLATARPPVTHTFPSPAEILAADPSAFAMPEARRRAIRALAEAVAADEIRIDPGVDPVELEAQLLALPGVGPWTSACVAMRALSHPDAFLPTDLGVRHALTRLGHPDNTASIVATAERWRPWRAYATAHLWSTLDKGAAA
jgi:AraC family transcriptional regulator, regulatory protein of adaptative response / DNA-3-methyladenine glycosylase II